MRSKEEQERLIELKKYEIEARYVHKQWDIESELSDYFEEKHGKYREIHNVNEEEFMEQEYIEMYDLEDYDMEEGDSI